MVRLDAAACEPLARVPVDYVESPEALAGEEARQALVDAAGDDWASVLVDPRTPEEHALVELFHEAERAFLQSINEGRRDDAG
jgi:hypothetical protein